MKECIKKVLRPVRTQIRRCWNGLRYLCSFQTFHGNPADAWDTLESLAPRPTSSAITDNKIQPANYDLSVIVPAYNAAKWLQVCLDSILEQETPYDFRVIAVDDGSTDETGKILDAYAGNPHMVVIHQANKGHSGARNVALKGMESRYVMFVDADDILLPGAITQLMHTADGNHADVVEGGAYAFGETGRIYDIKKTDCKHTSENLIGAPWAKVIASHLLSNLEFPEGYLYEDTIMGYLIFPQAKVISTISNEVYGYRIHPESITQTHTADPNRVDSFWIMLLMHENMAQLGIPADYDSYCRTMKHIVFTYRRCILLSDEMKKAIFICTRDFLQRIYPSYLNKQDKFYRLAQAMVRYQYGRYCVLCETFN